MVNNGLFNQRRYAYKDSQSTINALIDMSETWCENIDNNFQNVNMFLDISAAFDCGRHTTLLEKMKLYKFNPETVIIRVGQLTKKT